VPANEGTRFDSQGLTHYPFDDGGKPLEIDIIDSLIEHIETLSSDYQE